MVCRHAWDEMHSRRMALATLLISPEIRSKANTHWPAVAKAQRVTPVGEVFTARSCHRAGINVASRGRIRLHLLEKKNEHA
jgi:hypothetical protein